MHGSKNSSVLTKTFPGGAAYKAAATVPTASMCEWQRGSEEPSLPDSHSGSEGVLSTRVISTCAEMEASSPACGWGGGWGLTERRRLLLELTGRLPVATWPWVPAAWQPWEAGQAGPRQAGSGWGRRAQRAWPHVFLEGCRPSAGAAPPRRSQGPRTRCCQCSRLRIWNRDYCGAGSIPGLGTATCQGCGREKKKKVSQKKPKFRNIQALY